MIYSNLNVNAVVVEYLVSLFKEDPSVNDIIFGLPEERDFLENINFPLVNIMQTEVRLNETRIEFDFDIAIVCERNTQKRLVDKFYGDNVLDNLTDATAIFVKAMNILMLTHNDYDIEIVSFPSAQTITGMDKTIVDGCETTITLSIQNEISSLR